MLTVENRLRAAATEVRDYANDMSLPELDPTLRPAPEQGPTVRPRCADRWSARLP